MKLSEKDVKLFFGLMLPLLYYVNEKKNVVKNVKSYKDFLNCSFSEKKNIRDCLYEHIEIIDEFIEDNADAFDKSELDIVWSWKSFISGSFIIERLLNKYAVFVGGEKVYAVLSLQESFSEVLQNKPIPLYVKTVLLPFRGCIVYDGFLEPYGLSFGGGIKSSMKEIYMNAKENGTIIHGLLAAPSQIVKLPVQKVGNELSKLISEIQSIKQNLDSVELSPVEANHIINLLKVTIQYAAQRFNSCEDHNAADKQFRKLKQAVSRIEKSVYE
jgi:hypothetical protein